MTTPSLPTGTVTFLFTDIEGSTHLWQQDPNAMKQALARHHALIREAIDSHEGYVFQIVGDAFCSAFNTAPDAVAAALRGQRGLAAEPWGALGPIRVRMAVHTGTAEVRAGEYTSGEYVSGPSLNRVARLLSAAHGGQVLISAATEALVGEHLPTGVGLRDLGLQRLRDFPRPEHVFQLSADDLPSTFPALRTLAPVGTNLPAQVTTFVGREREMTQLRRLMGETRLLTITGPGGSGKTRLCLEVTHGLLERYPDGVWLAELAALADPALVSQALAAAISVREEANRPLSATLVEFLRSRHTLLVLDNCEHLIDACVALADALVRGCPNVSILATSREPLGMTGEVAFRVPSLSVPDPRAQSSVERLVEYEAVRLFVDRVRAVRPDFAVTSDVAPAVSEICFRLDGIPLAIELAAARVKALSVQQIAEHLNERFRLLTGGSRTALPRHQTLRGLIDWSYGLLSPSEALMFRRLSVFVGGFPLEAADDICRGDGIDGMEILDLLSRLVDKSLVVVDEKNGNLRYRLLETIRQYGVEKLSEGAEAEHVRDRHRDFYLAFAETALQRLQGAEQIAWLARLEADHDNLRAALRWSLDRSHLEHALRFGSALWMFWDMRGHLREAHDGLAELVRAVDERSVRELSPAARRAQANVLDGAGRICERYGEHTDALAYLERSVSLLRELDAEADLAEVLNDVGDHRRLLGDRTGGKAAVEESLALFRKLSNPRGIAHALNNLALILEEDGDHDRARALYEESVPLFKKAGDNRGLSHALNNLGGALAHAGLFVDAEILCRESLRLAQELDDWHAIGTALRGLGSVAHDQRNHAGAESFYADSIARFRAMHDRTCLGRALVGLALACHDAGDHERARALADEGLGLLRGARALADLVALLSRLGNTALTYGDGRHAMRFFGEALLLHSELGDRVGVVAKLTDLARAAEAQQQPRMRATLLAAASTLRHDRPGSGADPGLETIRAGIGPEEFEAAWAEGASMTIDDVVAYARSLCSEDPL